MNERSFVSWQRDLRSLALGQALGAFNDNLFKTVVSLLAVRVLAGADESLFLSLTGVVFMAPYLLFSIPAGVLADRVSKRDLLLWTKAGEVAAAVVAAAALALGSLPLMLLALFLLATQAAIFSPAKYGILPEIVAASHIPKANGMLELTRYSAVILGTAAGGILAAFMGDRPGRLGPIFIAVALLGVLAMARVGQVDGDRRSPSAAGAIRRGISRIAGDRRLRAAVAGMTYFEFAGALLALNLLIVGDEVMGLGEAAIGGLGAAAGIGVGLGAWIAGRICRGSVRLALAPLGALGVGASLILMWMALPAPHVAAMALALAGTAGGFLVVPLNAWIQISAGADTRGAVVGVNNLLNMTGVLAASGGLWVALGVLGLDPGTLILLLGLISVSAAPVLAIGLFREPPTSAVGMGFTARSSLSRLASAAQSWRGR